MVGHAPILSRSSQLITIALAIACALGVAGRYGASIAAKEYLIPKLGWFGGETTKQLEDLNASLSAFQTSHTEGSELIRESLDTSIEASTELKQQLQGMLHRVTALEEREDRSSAASRRSGETVTEELRHLKSLLLNRRSFATPHVGSAASADAPAAVVSPNVDKWTRMIAPQVNGAGGGPATRTPSIPAWQLPAIAETTRPATMPAADATPPTGAAPTEDSAASPSIPAWQRTEPTAIAPPAVQAAATPADQATAVGGSEGGAMAQSAESKQGASVATPSTPTVAAPAPVQFTANAEAGQPPATPTNGARAELPTTTAPAWVDGILESAPTAPFAPQAPSTPN